MSKTLMEIAQQLESANKKVQLIYAFNGVGKTRLFSRSHAPAWERIRNCIPQQQAQSKVPTQEHGNQLCRRA